MSFAQDFATGWDIGSDIVNTRKDRAISRAQSEGLSQMFPENQAAIPTPASGGAAPTSALPVDGAPAPAPGGETPEGGQGETQVDQMVAKKPTANDWVAMRTKIAQKILDSGGDMKKVAEFQDYVTNQKYKNLSDYAAMAISSMQAGDYEAAGEALERAYSAIGNGTTLQVRPAPDGGLYFVAKDDETGETKDAGGPLSAEQIATMFTAFKDVETFATMQFDQRKFEEEMGFKKQKLAVDSAAAKSEASSLKASEVSKREAKVTDMFGKQYMSENIPSFDVEKDQDIVPDAEATAQTLVTMGNQANYRKNINASVNAHKMARDLGEGHSVSVVRHPEGGQGLRITGPNGAILSAPVSIFTSRSKMQKALDEAAKNRSAPSPAPNAAAIPPS
jgi:hypothetical protein